jgi:hypothetical protein
VCDKTHYTCKLAQSAHTESPTLPQTSYTPLTRTHLFVYTSRGYKCVSLELPHSVAALFDTHTHTHKYTHTHTPHARPALTHTFENWQVDLFSSLEKYKPGDVVTVTVRRGRAVREHCVCNCMCVSVSITIEAIVTPTWSDRARERYS